ncbi:MAG: adenylosuccinate synthase [Prevotellaceae bacterium]|jgi:adenylosuccinate synthase|nr:adenylosuccinate synthase [Prevotellaceae bacterium]
MKTDVLLGLQWGDEGKGKVVDVLTPKYDVVARFQGGPNAGHSLEFDDVEIVLHTVPSGIFHKNIVNVIGNGVVIDPGILKGELEKLKQLGVEASGQLMISKKAHLILPTHRIIDAASEAAKGKSKIGSTLKGIGPAYMDKTGRNGLRVGEILESDFKERYEQLKRKHIEFLRQFDYEYTIEEEGFFAGVEWMKRFRFVDSEFYINRALNENKHILAEGAQGTLLDVDFGTYPFVTSSNTICAGACTGLGLAPRRIGEVYGIFKAYCTRVGSGPFPTELTEDTGEKLRSIGHEYGSTTGRPRRTGWLDLVALKYSVMINGVTRLIMTKSDVLDTFDSIKLATAYEINGKETAEFPYELNEAVKPVYKEMKGWNTPISDIRDYDKLPEELRLYVKFIETETGVPVDIVSVGPNRDQTIIRALRDYHD